MYWLAVPLDQLCCASAEKDASATSERTVDIESVRACSSDQFAAQFRSEGYAWIARG